MSEMTGLPQEDTIQKFNGVKRAMIRHLTQAKEYVQGTTFMEVDFGRVRDLRKTVRASYTSYIVAAVAKAVPQFPLINSQIAEEGLLIRSRVNLGVALDHKGRLMVPVIHDADRLDLAGIDEKIREFRTKAEERRMAPEDLADATFSITNSGVFGSAFFTPIISYPQSAILGVGGVVERPVVRDGEIVIRPICTFCLSYDHRAIEGSVAVGFLAKVRELIENFEA